MELLDHIIVPFWLFETPLSCFHKGCTSLHSHQQCVLFSTSSPAPVSCHLAVAPPTGVRWQRIVVWFVFPWWVMLWSSFSCACWPLYVFFGKTFVQVLCPFLNLFFLACSHVISFHILDICLLSVTWFVDIFSHSVAFSFCWWLPSLCRSFLVWCSSHLLTFPFVNFAILIFGDLL